MTAATKGVYITLLCLMYEAEGPLGQSWDTLARRSGCTLPAFKKAVQALVDDAKVEISDAGIWSDKCAKHITQRRERSSSAKAAAKTRWEKTQQKQGKADANAKQPQCQPEPEPEPEVKETTNVVSKKSDPGKRKSRLPEDWRLPKDWGQWAISKGMDELSIRREAEQFKDHHIGEGSLKLDWRRCWQTWVRNHLKWQLKREQPKQPTSGTQNAGAFGMLPEVG